MNPRGGIIALRLGATLQIFDIEKKQKLKSHKLEEEPSVFFWRWVTPDTIGMVTQSSVLHWSLSGQGEPEKMFDRHANLAACQIINYRVSVDAKWLLVVGIAPGQQQVCCFYFVWGGRLGAYVC